MNNSIRFYGQDVAVFHFLKEIKVDFEVHYTGAVLNSEWDHDSFMCKFTRDGKTLVSEYNTGVGFRVVRKDGILTASDKREIAKIDARTILIDQKSWSNGEKRIANKLGSPAFCRVFLPSPAAASVINCLLTDASLGNDTHTDFCANLGYDEDSRKGLEIYLSCQKIGNELNAFFTSAERERLNELLEDY